MNPWYAPACVFFAADREEREKRSLARLLRWCIERESVTTFVLYHPFLFSDAPDKSYPRDYMDSDSMERKATFVRISPQL